MTIVTGGKAVYGASLGILMLEARFPRIPGDMGNAGTWGFPVQYRVVRGASPGRVVLRHADGLLGAFVDAARDLVAHGVDGITTNCGFLSLFQDELAAAVSVPVATSSLMQVALVNRRLPPGRRAGILTISAATLTAEHLAKAGVPEGTPVTGLEGSTFARAILGDEEALDVAAAQAENVAAAGRLAAEGASAIVLECTNMSPYAAAIREASGLPVFTPVSFVRWFQASLAPETWSPPAAKGRR
jgi:Asp/Glu/hydantoin racemase